MLNTTQRYLKLVEKWHDMLLLICQIFTTARIKFLLIFATYIFQHLMVLLILQCSVEKLPNFKLGALDVLLYC